MLATQNTTQAMRNTVMNRFNRAHNFTRTFLNDLSQDVGRIAVGCETFKVHTGRYTVHNVTFSQKQHTHTHTTHKS